MLSILAGSEKQLKSLVILCVLSEYEINPLESDFSE